MAATSSRCEPPDQALCVGPPRARRSSNSVLRVFDKAGTPLIGRSGSRTTSSFDYPPAINRTTGVFGAFVTDPICHFDPGSGRFFMAVADPRSGPGQRCISPGRTDSTSPSVEHRGSDRCLESVQASRAERRHRRHPDHHCDPEVTPPDGMANPAPASATSRTSAPTRTASTSPPTSTRSSVIEPRRFATPVRRSTPSRSRSWSPAPRRRRWCRSRTRSSGRSAASPCGRRSHRPGRTRRSNGGTEYFLSSTLGDGSETGNLAPARESHRRLGDHQHLSRSTRRTGAATQQQVDQQPTRTRCRRGRPEGRSDSAAATASTTRAICSPLGLGLLGVLPRSAGAAA